MSTVFLVERLDDEGRTDTFGQAFTDKASAESAAAALNVVKDSYDEQGWYVYSLEAEETPQEFVAQVKMQIFRNPFSSKYEVSPLLIENEAVLAGTPLPETVISEPTQNHAYYSAQVYARTSDECMSKAQVVADDLNAKL